MTDRTKEEEALLIHQIYVRAKVRTTVREIVKRTTKMAEERTTKMAEDRDRYWQPIKTAPKDGTKIILYHKDWEDLPIAYWDWLVMCDDEGNGGCCIWHVSEKFSSLGDGYLWPEEQSEPSHWRLLPQLPTL